MEYHDEVAAALNQLWVSIQMGIMAVAILAVGWAVLNVLGGIRRAARGRM